jgi:hypothetical protein
VDGAENRTALAGHVDSSPDEGTVALWDLGRRCGELKCGFLVRDAEKHGNEGSQRLMAQRSLPRQLVAEGFPNQETSVKGLPETRLFAAFCVLSRSATPSPVPRDSRALGSLTMLDT